MKLPPMTLQPTPADKFTFGLWTVGNRGRDPFGDFVRPALDPCEAVRRLADLGAWGVNFHDNDLVPIDATPAERDRIVARLPRALDATGLTVPMATTNLFSDPVFKDGAFTSHDPQVRAYALQKTMRAMDLGVELGAQDLRVLGRTRGRRGGRGEGPGRGDQAIPRGDQLPVRVRARSAVRPAVRARSQAQRAARRHLLPDHGVLSRLHRHARRTRRWSASTPRSPTSTCSGLNFYHVVAQALEAGKLFHIDLNDQKPGRFDQDLRFGSESIKPLFFLVKLLEESGYDGPRHFDAHAYRTEDADGRVGLRARLHADVPDPQGQGAAVRRGSRRFRRCSPRFAGPDERCSAPYSREASDRLKARTLRSRRAGVAPLPYERLDQLVVDLLLGVR